MLGFMLWRCHLDTQDLFEQGALHFHFTLGPTNSVASLPLSYPGHAGGLEPG